MISKDTSIFYPDSKDVLKGDAYGLDWKIQLFEEDLQLIEKLAVIDKGHGEKKRNFTLARLLKALSPKSIW